MAGHRLSRSTSTRQDALDHLPPRLLEVVMHRVEAVHKAEAMAIGPTLTEQSSRDMTIEVKVTIIGLKGMTNGVRGMTIGVRGMIIAPMGMSVGVVGAVV